MDTLFWVHFHMRPGIKERAAVVDGNFCQQRRKARTFLGCAAKFDGESPDLNNGCGGN